MAGGVSVTPTGEAGAYGTRHEQRAWYWYDWANSAFPTTVITVFAGPFLTAAAEAAQACHQALASARLGAGAKGLSLAQRVAKVRREAARSMTAIRAEVQATAELPVTKIAQLTNAPAAKVARVVQAYASKGEAA